MVTVERSRSEPGAALRGVCGPAPIRLNLEHCEVRSGFARTGLAPQEMALLAVYALARIEDWPGAGPLGVGPGHRGWIATRDFLLPEEEGGPFAAYLACYRLALGVRDLTPLARLRGWAQNDPQSLQLFFQRKRSRLDKALRAAGAAFSRLRLATARRKPHRAGLLVAADAIAFSSVVVGNGYCSKENRQDTHTSAPRKRLPLG